MEPGTGAVTKRDEDKSREELVQELAQLREERAELREIIAGYEAYTGGDRPAAPTTARIAGNRRRETP